MELRQCLAGAAVKVTQCTISNELTALLQTKTLVQHRHVTKQMEDPG